MITEKEIIGLHVVRTTACIASIIGSVFVLQNVLRSPTRRRRVMTRLLVGMALMDLLFTITTILGPLAVPRSFSNMYPTSISWAVGTWETCQAFGFVGQSASIASVLYNVSLTFYYLVTIRYGWKERRLRRRELWLHGIPLLVGWGTGLAALLLEFFNPTLLSCRLASYPPRCGGTSGIPCERGENVDVLKLLNNAFIWSVFVFFGVAMTLIYWKIDDTDRGRRPPQNSNNRSTTFFRLTSFPGSQIASSFDERPWRRQRSGEVSLGSEPKIVTLKRQFATQALLYCFAFAITWFFPTLGFFVSRWTNRPPTVPMLYLINSFFPLQGFWNAFIYVRPRYLRYRKEQREAQEREEQVRRQQQALQAQEQGDVPESMPPSFLSSDSSRNSCFSVIIGPLSARSIAMSQSLRVDAEDDYESNDMEKSDSGDGKTDDDGDKETKVDDSDPGYRISASSDESFDE